MTNEDNIETKAEVVTEETIMESREVDDDAALERILGTEDKVEDSAVGETPAAELDEGEAKEEDAVELDEGMLRALRRDGVPADVIEQVSKDEELFAEWATKAMKRQANVDAYTEKVKALEERASSSEEPALEKSTDVSEPTDAEEESKVETIQLDALTDELGEEAVEPIRKMQEQLTSMQEQLDEANRNVAMSEVQLAVEQAAPSVLKSWGEVSEEQRSAVINRMGELGKAKPRTFASIEELMRDAATDVLGTPSVTKRSATPSPPSRVAKLERPASLEDKEDAALEVILGGGTVDQARQASMR